MNNRFTIFTFSICILISVLVYVGIAFNKVVPSGDETISYLCATGNQEHYQQVLDGQILNGNSQANDWQSFFKSSPTQFKNIAHDLTQTDLHPPLYFWLLHVFLYLPIPLFSAGVLLNLVLHLVTLYVFWRLLHELGLTPLVRCVTLLLWSLSAAVVAVGFYARQYELLALVHLLSVLFFIQYLQHKSWWRLGLLAVALTLGMLTQYLYIYFSVIYVLYAWFKHKNIKVLAAVVVAFVLVLLIHPGIIQQFQLQQARTVEVVLGDDLIARTGKVILAFIQVFLPVMAMKSFLMALPKIVVALVCCLVIAVVLVLMIINRHKLANIFVVNVPSVVMWLFMAGLILSIVPYLFKLLPFHAMGGQYFVLIYPFLFIVLASVITPYKKWLVAVLSIVIVGLLVQVFVFVRTQQQYQSLVTQIQSSQTIVINSVNRRAFPRFIPYLSTQQIIVKPDVKPAKQNGVLYMVEVKDANQPITANNMVRYNLQDGVVLDVGY
jgi:uncharacterized membrane protein